jgi:NADH-quinone oxidoreductase subunit C
MSKKIVARVVEAFPDAVLETHDQLGDDTVVVRPERWAEIARFLRDDGKCQLDHFIDLTAVDYFGRREPRFEVVLHVRSMALAHRVRLKAPIGALNGEPPRIESLCDVWRGANWFERECFDMFGIDFVGHPDLRRILMYPEFVGHPLCKDYPAQRAQPLIPYREGVDNDKLPPFGPDEGMPFGRQTHDHAHVEPNLLGFEDERKRAEES